MLTTFLGWFKTRAGMINLGLYVLVGVIVVLGYLSWQNKIKQNAILTEANNALTTQLSDISAQLMTEREINERLEVSRKIIISRREVSEEIIEESKDEDGNITIDAVATVLCSRGLAEPSACRAIADKSD